MKVINFSQSDLYLSKSVISFKVTAIKVREVIVPGKRKNSLGKETDFSLGKFPDIYVE